MPSADEGRDKRIQATISAELKDRVRVLIDSGTYDSEAEVVRAALSRFIDEIEPVTEMAAYAAGSASLPLPERYENGTAEMHRDLKVRLDVIAWLQTVNLLLASSSAARILRLLGEQNADSLRLIEQSLNTTAGERKRVRRKLAAGWRAFNRARRQTSSTNSSSGQQEARRQAFR